MKKSLSFVIAFLLIANTIVSAQQKTAIGRYLSSDGGQGMGDFSFEVEGRTIRFWWDKVNTRWLPHEEDAYRAGAEWRIMYLLLPNQSPNGEPLILRATFTGRVLSESNQSLPQTPKITSGQIDFEALVRQLIDDDKDAKECFVQSGSNIEDFEKNSLSISSIDLNGDKKPEMQITGKDIDCLCSIHGMCSFWFYEKTANGWKLLLSGSGGASVSKISTNNYRNISEDRLSGAYEKNVKIYKFDGMRYQAQEYLEYKSDQTVNRPYGPFPWKLVRRRKLETESQPVSTSGYIDVIEANGSGCRIRFISGDKSYTGIISFDRLFVLTGRRIRSFEDALAFFEGKQINVTLSGITTSSDSFSTGSFGGITKITVLAPKGPIPTKPQWKETTTATETIIDLSTDILFDFNKSTINPKAIPSLIKLARLLRQSKGNAVQLNGFTDSIGGDEYNVGLSQRRSEAVKQWLLSKGGIDAERLATNGYGKAQPVAPNTNPDGSDNPTGRQKNRRVEIRIPRN